MSVFVDSAANYGNVPLPLMLKIERSIFYIPSMYVVPEGVANAICEFLKNLGGHGDKQVHRAILMKNSMKDQTHALILRGLLACPEFFSLTTCFNQIGIKSAHYICKLLDKNYGDKSLNLDLPEEEEIKPEEVKI